jgi:hypothetical protein
VGRVIGEYRVGKDTMMDALTQAATYGDPDDEDEDWEDVSLGLFRGNSAGACPSLLPLSLLSLCTFYLFILYSTFYLILFILF